MKIILFDMDGVLLHSLGYHRALQQTVRLVGEAMGYTDIDLTDEHIAAFESHGVTSEWYSGAMCSAYLYLLAKRDGKLSAYPASLEPQNNHRLNQALEPQPLFEALGTIPLEGLTQLERVVLATQQVAKDIGISGDEYTKILMESENPHTSITFRTFQEMVLGSRQFKETYGLSTEMQSESFLSVHDIPLLDADQQQILEAWLEKAGNFAAILTNRPSLQIPGTPSTPEAEIGAQLVGLAQLPIVGFGEINWLAARQGVDSGTLNKPAALHALAALQSAVGVEASHSMTLAFDMVSGTSDLAEWQQFKDTEIYFLEDTVGGLISLERAAEVLAARGIHTRIHKIGISPNPVKKKALKANGAKTYDNINQALDEILKTS